MKITILGCGSSSGVPMIGCGCAVCKSRNKKNKRMRASILVEHKNCSILVDTSPDLHQQAINNNIKKIDAVLYTHAHADHVMGIDELRSFNFLHNRTIEVYSNRKTLDELRQRFDYAFLPPTPEKGWYRPALLEREIYVPQKFNIGDVAVQSFLHIHGTTGSIGYRFGKFAYSTDVNSLPDGSFEILKGIDVWLVDCLRHDSHPTHANLNTTLEWIDRVQPKKTILTHMSHDFDYNKLQKKLPKNVVPGYDGMVISL